MGRSIKITGIKELEAKLKKNATLDDARTVVKKNGAELQFLLKDTRQAQQKEVFDVHLLI